MALDFPSSPTTNQEYTYKGRTWIYNGSGWQIKPTALQYVDIASGLGFHPFSAQGGVIGAVGDIGDTYISGSGIITSATYTNLPTVSASYTVPAEKNSMMVGPVTILDGVTMTIPTDARLVII